MLSFMVAPETWSQELTEATKIGDLSMIPYELAIPYEVWSYRKSPLKSITGAYFLANCSLVTLKSMLCDLFFPKICMAKSRMASILPDM